MELPRGWGIVQEIVTVDASCFQIYMQNMKSVFMEMAKNADMVMFNRCRPEDPLPSFRRSIKVVNQACDVLFENEEGEIDNIFEDQMPFDTDADVIEIDDADYGIWYVDMGDNPERYEGKTVHFRGMVLKSKDVGADFFVPGRMATVSYTHLFGQATHYDIFRKMGAHLDKKDGKVGAWFTVWAPHAAEVSVIGEFNGWDAHANVMRKVGEDGVYEVFIPGVTEGMMYKYYIRTPEDVYKRQLGDCPEKAFWNRVICSALWSYSRFRT